MKRFVFFPLLGLASLGFAADLTLEEAVSTGLKNSSRLAAVSARVRRSKSQVSRAATALAPDLSFNATGTVLNQGVQNTFGPLTVIGANQWQSRLSLNASLAFDISGDLRRNVGLVALQAEVSRLEYAAEVNRLTRDIQIAFWQTLQAQRLTESAQSALNNSLARQDTLAKLLAQGVTTQFDLLRAKTEVADASQKVTSANNRVKVARANLIRLTEMGLSEVDNLIARDSTDENPTTPVENGPKRPEIAQAKLGIKAAELNLKLASQSERPTLGLGLQSYLLTNPSTFEPSRIVSAASLNFSVPIVDRGLSKAKKFDAQAAIAEATAQLKEVERAIAFETFQAETQLIDATERTAVAKAALAQATEQYRLAEVRLKSGITQGNLSPLLELSDSQTALTQARNNLINAEIEAEIARVTLRSAKGEWATNPTEGRP